MLHFSEYQQLSGSRKLLLPEHVRAALGYGNRQELHVVLPIDRSGEDTISNELIVSSIDPAIWGSLWHVGMICKDRPGLISDVTSFAEDEGVDILSCKTAVTDSGRLVRMEILADASHYQASRELPPESVAVIGSERGIEISAERRLEDFSYRVIAEFIDDLNMARTGPEFAVRHNAPLWRANHEAEKSYKTQVSDSCIMLRDQCVREILSRYARSYGTKYKGPDPNGTPLAQPYAFLAAETDFSLLRVTLTFNNSGYTNVRILGEDSPETLGLITSTLKSAGFNVCQAYTRKYRETSKVRLDLLLQLPPSRDHVGDDDRLQAYLRTVLDGVDLRIDFYEPQVLSSRARRTTDDQAEKKHRGQAR